MKLPRNKAELFGLKDENVDTSLRERIVLMEEDNIQRVDRPDLIWTGHESLPGFCSVAAAAHHLSGNNDRARHYGQRAIVAIKAYFFGDWRTKVPTDDKKIDPRWWRDKESWSDEFRRSVCWAMVLNDWESVRQIAAYPDHGRSMEESGIDKKPARREFFIALAEFLRGDPVRNVAQEVEKASGATWRGTSVLAHTLDAIINKDQAAIQKYLIDFFTIHHKWKGKRSIDDFISIEGTIMFYLAAHEGHAIELPPKLRPYLIELN